MKDSSAGSVIIEQSANYNLNNGHILASDNIGTVIGATRGGVVSSTYTAASDQIGTSWCVLCHSFGGTHATHKLFKNDDDTALSLTSSINIGFTQATITDTINIAARDNALFFWAGQFARLVAFPLLSDANRGKWMRFLGAKFNITIT